MWGHRLLCFGLLALCISDLVLVERRRERRGAILGRAASRVSANGSAALMLFRANTSAVHDRLEALDVGAMVTLSGWATGVGMDLFRPWWPSNFHSILYAGAGLGLLNVVAGAARAVYLHSVTGGGAVPPLLQVLLSFIIAATYAASLRRSLAEEVRLACERAGAVPPPAYQPKDEDGGAVSGDDDGGVSEGSSTDSDLYAGGLITPPSSVLSTPSSPPAIPRGRRTRTLSEVWSRILYQQQQGGSPTTSHSAGGVSLGGGGGALLTTPLQIDGGAVGYGFGEATRRLTFSAPPRPVCGVVDIVSPEEMMFALDIKYEGEE